MFAFVLLAVLGADNFDLIGVKADVAKLKLEVAELKADLFALKAARQTAKTGSVEVVSAREVHAFNPVKAAANVATAPLRAVGRVCGPGGCVEEPTVQESLTVPASANWSQGDCSNGQCMPTQRRGFFGRRRGW